MQNYEAMRIPIDNLEAQAPAVFSYPKADIMRVVEARTSVIGQMRGDKDNLNYIERMSLTEGESFLSDDMLLEAIEKVHEYLQAFTRGEEHACELDANDNIVFTLQPKPWWDRAALSSVDINIKNALIEYIIYLWFEMANPDEAAAHYAKYENYAHEAQLGMNRENGTLERRYNTPFNTIFEGRK